MKQALLSTLAVFLISLFALNCDSKAGTKSAQVTYDSTMHLVLYWDDTVGGHLRSGWLIKVVIQDFFFTDTTRTEKILKDTTIWIAPIVDSMGRTRVDSLGRAYIKSLPVKNIVRAVDDIDIDSILKKHK